MDKADPKAISTGDEFLKLILGQLRDISGKLDVALALNSPPTGELVDLKEPARAKKGAPRA